MQGAGQLKLFGLQNDRRWSCTGSHPVYILIFPKSEDTLPIGVFMKKHYTESVYWKDLIKAGLCKLLILRELKKGPLHGYEVIRRIGETTHEFCHPSEGAIYPILREFMQSGYVRMWLNTFRGRERKEYSLTAKGREALKTGNAVWRRSIKFLQTL